MAGNQKGNIILTARGDLINLLSQRALGYGEMFIATKGYTTTAMAAQNPIYDISGGKKVQIKRIDAGDLFAGTNTKDEVYCLGGGSSLKWGGISFATSWDLAKNEAKENPNRIYMYVGSTTLNSDAQAKQKAGAVETAEITEKYVASDSKEYLEPINPGDIFFYSPQLEQLVVLHLNHSSDALTKIAVDDLVSNSMRALLAEGDTKASTLKDFLDGPARHFQYLESTYGWAPLTNQEGIQISHSEGNDSHLRSIQFLNKNNDYFKDGEVFYIPFDKGLNVYTIVGPEGNPLPGLENVEKFYEGDLIIALPDESKNSNSEYKMVGSDPKGIRFAHVSLYGGLVRQLIPGEITRADDYATYLWKTTSATTNDTDFLNAVDENGDLINGIKEYIERLYQTKVDIDPKTHKIISSQLPDYLLGSLKYMGPASSLGKNVEEINTDTYTGADLYKFLNSKKYSNFDSNENSYDGSDPSGDVVAEGADSKDTEMRVGSYWIWQGDSIKVTGLTGIFDFDEAADDLWGNGEDDDPESRENTTHTVEHVLNKGDWIVFNSNEKFDIIDHTANFVGLMVNGQILGGLVNVVDSDRTMTGRSWENGSKTFTVESVLETKVEPEAEDKLKISNPNGVLFKDKSGKAKVNATALPLISDTGLAFNSRFLVKDNQQGFKLGSRADTSGQSVTFLFGKYSDIAKPTEDAWDSIPEAFKVKSFWDEDDDTVVAFNGDRYPTDISKNFEGFNFGNFLFEESKDAEDIYLFKFEWEKEPVAILPSHSGILATEDYVDYGFTVIKRIIDDLYLAFKKTLTGNEDWLQTIVEYQDEDGTTRKKIYDSKVKQDYSKGESLILRLYTISKEDGTDSNPSAFTRFGTLSEIPSNLNDKRNSVVPSKEGYAVNYVLGNDSDAQTLNPSKPVGDVLNILPNHSGMLLNDNSVIDGGEW